MKLSKSNIDKRRRKLKALREKLVSTQLNGIRELLTNKTIEGICKECEYYFRERLLTPVVTIFHMIGAGISREGSFQSAWHNIGETGRSDALSRARKRLPLKVWEGIDKKVRRDMGDEFRDKSLW
ncbi:MAG: hypothetical protein AB1422_18775 [bacterium]